MSFMPKRISNELREEISRLYDDGKGRSPAEISRQTGISYFSVYGMTKARQRINPGTGKPFESRTEYNDYSARQRVEDNKDIIGIFREALGITGWSQIELAKEIGTSRQSISFYIQGKTAPGREKLERLLEILDTFLHDDRGSLDDLVE